MDKFFVRLLKHFFSIYIYIGEENSKNGSGIYDYSFGNLLYAKGNYHIQQN